MANYVKATNFTAKDSLPSGNAGKIVKGAEIDTELNAVASAISSKADLNSPALTGTPTAPTAVANTNTTQIATTAFALAAAAAVAFPVGGIVMWSGSIASIPSGWVLCNGSNGTPDLRNRFVVGAGSTYSVAAIGGSADAIVVSHTHTASSTSSVSDPGHSHFVQGNSYGGTPGGLQGLDSFGDALNGRQSNSSTTGITVSTSTSISSTGSSGTNANLPPYYALAFIMKT